MAKPFLKSVNDLLDMLESKKQKTNFVLYAGLGKEQGKVIHRHEGNDAEESREELENLLRKFEASGGDFTVYVVEEAGKTNGDTLHLRLRGGATNEPNNAANIGNISGLITERELTTILENERLKAKLDRLEDKINGLETAPRPNSSIWERLLEKSLDDEGSGKELISGISGMFKGLGIAAMQYAKTAKQQPTPPLIAQEPPCQAQEPQETGQGQKAKFRGEKLLAICEAVKSEFPEAEPQDILERLIISYKNSDEIEKEIIKDKLFS
jgi:hypothetical protein